LAEDAPSVLAHPEAARGLEQALIDAMVACIRTGDAGEDRAARRQHTRIMRRFHREIEDNLEQVLFIPDLCAALGVSERTLRACCEESLGTSPHRYLVLRRMHLARKALQEGRPTTTSVTDIAAQWGFWNFGRFAGEYKLLFGELPSVTLTQPKD
jgi:AraC-like DNA-binding protein